MEAIKSINQMEVAKKAGVARSAVSMYINDYPGLSDSARERIKKAIDELDYRPSRIARSLKGNKSLLLGAVYFGNPSGTVHDFVLLDLYQGLQKAAFEEGYAIIFFFKENRTSKETMAEAFKTNVEGIVFFEDNFDPAQIKKIELPKVVINRQVQGIPSVWADVENGIYQATEYLHRLGHSHIAYIGGPLSEATFQQRRDGFDKAMKNKKIKVNKKIALNGMLDNKDGYLAMSDLLKSGEKITAVVCDNDLKAWGAMDAAIDAGLNIPGDISIIGFDNIPQCEKMPCPLTTMEHPRKESAYTGGKMLLEMISNKTKGNDTVLKCKLIERASCAAPQTK
jgi:LacI family transcriptional regulator